MTPRTFLSIVLLGLIFPVQEFWQLWRNSDKEVNWWIAIDYPLNVQWYLKFAGIHVADILKSIVIYRITYKIQSLRMAAIVVLIYSFIDLTLFIWCFNKAPYALILSTVGLVSLVVFNWKTLSQKIYNPFTHLFHQTKHQ